MLWGHGANYYIFNNKSIKKRMKGGIVKTHWFEMIGGGGVAPSVNLWCCQPHNTHQIATSTSHATFDEVK